MSERTRMAVFTVLWCTLVLAAAFTLWLAAVSRNPILVALAAIATFVVVRTHRYIPLPKIYEERGMTNDVFISRRQRRLNEKKRNGSAG